MVVVVVVVMVAGHAIVEIMLLVTDCDFPACRSECTIQTTFAR